MSSANILFHYTRSIDNLIGIIEKGFEHRPVREDLSICGFIESPFSIPGVVKYELVWHMVCFCDILLRDVHDHIEQYGSYGLGLDKEWGIEKGITPVRYIHYYTPDICDGKFMLSLTLRSKLPKYHNRLTFIIADMLKQNNEIDSFEIEDFENLPEKAQKVIAQLDVEMQDILNHIHNAGGFLKSHKGTWKDRVTGNMTERVFYDEREWRSLKTTPEQENILFKLNDVKAIFVKNSKERERIIELIMDRSDRLEVKDSNDACHKIHIIDDLLDMV